MNDDLTIHIIQLLRDTKCATKDEIVTNLQSHSKPIDIRNTVDYLVGMGEIVTGIKTHNGKFVPVYTLESPQ